MRPIAFAFAELYARGVMQHLLEPLRQARAVVWTGVLFGLRHALSGAWFDVRSTTCGSCARRGRWRSASR